MTPEHEARRKEILPKLARRKRGSAGLAAYADGEPVGFISLGPRSDYPGVEGSPAVSAVDDVPVWVIMRAATGTKLRTSSTSRGRSRAAG